MKIKEKSVQISNDAVFESLVEHLGHETFSFRREGGSVALWCKDCHRIILSAQRYEPTLIGEFDE